MELEAYGQFMLGWINERNDALSRLDSRVGAMKRYLNRPLAPIKAQLGLNIDHLDSFLDELGNNLCRIQLEIDNNEGELQQKLLEQKTEYIKRIEQYQDLRRIFHNRIPLSRLV